MTKDYEKAVHDSLYNSTITGGDPKQFLEELLELREAPLSDINVLQAFQRGAREAAIEKYLDEQGYPYPAREEQ